MLSSNQFINQRMMVNLSMFKFQVMKKDKINFIRIITKFNNNYSKWMLILNLFINTTWNLSKRIARLHIEMLRKQELGIDQEAISQKAQLDQQILQELQILEDLL